MSDIPKTDQMARERRRRERRAKEKELTALNQELPRWTIGGLTFLRKKPKDEHLPIVEDVALDCEMITSAFVSGVRPPSLPPDTYSGAVYRGDRKIVPEFLAYDALTQHRVPKRVNAPVVEASRVAGAERIDQTCVYLGQFSTHFGHFLLESLPRAWYLKQAHPSSLILFHSSAEKVALPPFAAAIFKVLGIDAARIRLANRDVAVAKLILPSSQYWQGIKASPGMCVVFDHIRDLMLRRRMASSPTPPKVYFSRRNLGPVRGSGKVRAVIANEQEAEAFFSSRGYEVLTPETLPFEDQVAVVANATHVAGVSGSALHMMLFNRNPQAKLIELRTKPAINQLLISAIRGNSAFHIWSARKDSTRETTILNMGVIERAMREID